MRESFFAAVKYILYNFVHTQAIQVMYPLSSVQIKLSVITTDLPGFKVSPMQPPSFNITSLKKQKGTIQPSSHLPYEAKNT